MGWKACKGWIVLSFQKTIKSQNLENETMTTTTKNRKAILSTLWTFVVLNYIYCDVITLMHPSFLNELLTGTVGGMEMTDGLLLGSSIFLEIPIAMVLLSRVLGYRANRMANIVAGSLMTIGMIVTMFMGTPATYYLFFGIIEIAATVFIVFYAWKWKPETRNPKS